jgi:hypothetical protein
MIVRYAALAITNSDMFTDQVDTGLTEQDKQYHIGMINPPVKDSYLKRGKYTREVDFICFQKNRI